MTRTFRILWPTIRPQMMRETFRHWMDKSSRECPIYTTVAVNTEDDKKELSEFDVVVVGNEPENRGPAWAVHQMTQSVKGDGSDIIIVVSDDFYAPESWDLWLSKQFEDFDGGLVVFDGFQRDAEVVTLPIMTVNCLERLNKIIYHPDYKCGSCDVELYINLKELGLLKDLRPDTPIFTHKHHCNGLRVADKYDNYAMSMVERDISTRLRRLGMPIEERLKL